VWDWGWKSTTYLTTHPDCGRWPWNS